jgi:hypothetical protein
MGISFSGQTYHFHIFHKLDTLYRKLLEFSYEMEDGDEVVPHRQNLGFAPDFYFVGFKSKLEPIRFGIFLGDLKFDQSNPKLKEKILAEDGDVFCASFAKTFSRKD